MRYGQGLVLSFQFCSYMIGMIINALAASDPNRFGHLIDLFREKSVELEKSVALATGHDVK